RPPTVRYRSNGSPTIRGAPTSTSAGSATLPRAQHSIPYSSNRSLRLSVLIAHHGNEQVGDAGPAHVAKRGELLTIDAIEQQDAAAEHLPLVNRLEGPRCGETVGM